MAQNSPIRQPGFNWRKNLTGILKRKVYGRNVGQETHYRGVAVTLSTLISCVLWFSFTMTEEYTIEAVFPTVVDNLPPGVALKDLPPPAVRVELRGEGFQVFRLKYNPQTIHLNTTSGGELSVANILPELPKNVVVQNVIPRVINLDIGQKVTRKVPVQLMGEVLPADAYDFIQPVILEPDSVTISGAQSVVNTITNWPTESFTFSGVKDSLNSMVALSDTLTGLVQRNPHSISLSARTALFTSERRILEVIPVGITSSKEELRFEPATVTAEFRVRFSEYFELNRIGSTLFYAEVHQDSLRSSRDGFVTPSIVYPREFDIRDLTFTPRKLRFYWRQN